MLHPSHARSRMFRVAGWIGIVAVGLAHAQTAASGGAVEGVVLNAGTGAGIPGATVMLNNAANRYTTTTDAVGHFKISAVAAGNYRASVEKDGFDEPVPDLTSFGRPTLQVTSSIDPVHLDLKMTARSAIRGRVLDADGKPLAGVEVNLNPNIFGGETTDQQGRYALRDIRAGTYTLTARVRSSLKPIEAPDGSRTAMVTTYYPSVDDAALAQQVVFQGQGDLDGYDIRLRTLPVHRVKGIVLDEQGMPAVNAELSLYRPAGTERATSMLSLRPGGSMFLFGVRRAPFGEPEVRVTTGKDGRFELPAVPKGEWRIAAESDPMITEGRLSRGATSVVVTRGDVEDVRIDLAMPFKLTAAVEHQGATSAGGATPLQSAFAVALIGADDNEVGQTGIEREGVVTIENLLPGRYRAFTKPGFVARIFLGDNEVTGQDFSLSAGAPKLRVVLNRRSGSVRGTVERGEGATAVLIPRQTESAGYGQTALCGPGGSFEFNDVSPGDYTVAAIDRITGMPPSPAILGLVSFRGTSVRVEEGVAANVTLSVITASR